VPLPRAPTLLLTLVILGFVILLVEGSRPPPAEGPPPSDPVDAKERAPERESVATRLRGALREARDAVPIGNDTLAAPRTFRVLDDVGAPVAGAAVAVLDDVPDPGEPAPRDSRRPPLTSGATSMDGTFVVGAGAPRAGAVRVRAAGFVEVTLPLEPFLPDVRLERAGRLSLRVVDAEGRPIALATARAVGAARDIETRTGADGRAELPADSTGVRRLEVFADGFLVWTLDTARAGLLPHGPLLAVLEAAAPLPGRVLAQEDGAPIAGARVALLSGAAELVPLSIATTDARGGFALSVVPQPNTEARLDVRAPGRLRNVVLLEFYPPTVLLELGRTVRGIVRDAHGRPVADVPVRAMPIFWAALPPYEDEEACHATTDADGRFSLLATRRVSAPSWHLVAQGADGSWGSSPVPEPEGPAEGPPVLVELEAVRSLEGRVVSPDGAGLAGVRVRPRFTADSADWSIGQATAPSWDGGVPYHALGPVFGSCVTEPDGRFRLASVPEGRLLLSFEIDGVAVGYLRDLPPSAPDAAVLGPIVLPAGAISGVVLSATRRPVAGARVTLERYQASWEFVARGSLVPAGFRETRTDPSGRFRFPAIGPTDAFALDAFAADGTRDRLSKVSVGDGPVELQLHR